MVLNLKEQYMFFTLLILKMFKNVLGKYLYKIQPDDYDDGVLTHYFVNQFVFINVGTQRI